MQITNPKIASLEPTWARFCGLSVLFDNPSPASLYSELSTAVDAWEASLGRIELRDRYGWCRLPPASLHVTVCDGPNQSNRADLPATQRIALQTALDGLPNSLSALPECLRYLLPTQLAEAAAANPVQFRVDEIVGWGHVLAARLAPARAADRRAFEHLVRSRDEFVAGLADAAGLRVAAWRPHISLGYFASSAGAALAQRELPAWNEGLRGRVTESIRFDSLALYGFTDITHFQRRPER